MSKDQMPGDGCGNCGAYAEETQSVKRKRLVWDGSTWICRTCNKAEVRRQEGQL